MYDLIHVAGGTYYIDCPVKVGVVVSDGEAVLIDSGNDAGAGKKIKRILDENGWTLRAIFNTHSHADHIGGNRLLVDRTGCAVYAVGLERAFTRRPIMEPTILFGANPPSELRHKFMLASPTDALELTPDVLPEGWETIPLPGHFFDMVGFRTPDDVVFLADCLSSEATIQKYRVSFLVDPAAYIETLEKVAGMSARLFVPSHADATEDIAPLAKKNIEATLRVGDVLERLCRGGTTFEDLLARLFVEYDLYMTFEQHALVGSAVRSYLTWLRECGRVAADIVDNRIVWTS